MTRTIGQKLDAQVRQLRTMRQNRDAEDAGDLTEVDLARMAFERLYGEDALPERAGSGDGLEPLGIYCRDAGMPLLDLDPWFVSHWTEPEPGVDDDPSDLPARTYRVDVATRGTKRYVLIDLDWTNF